MIRPGPHPCACGCDKPRETVVDLGALTDELTAALDAALADGYDSAAAMRAVADDAAVATLAAVRS
jgi:hypothetical protein